MMIKNIMNDPLIIIESDIPDKTTFFLGGHFQAMSPHDLARPRMDLVDIGGHLRSGHFSKSSPGAPKWIVYQSWSWNILRWLWWNELDDLGVNL